MESQGQGLPAFTAARIWSPGVSPPASVAVPYPFAQAQGGFFVFGFFFGFFFVVGFFFLC